jgi:hypothetical protein
LLKLNAGFTEKGLDPVVWGQVASCKYAPTVAGQRTQILLDGENNDVALSIYLGESVSFSGLSQHPVLVRLAGTIAVDGVSSKVGFSFSFDPVTRQTAFLVELSSGGVIAEMTTRRTFDLRAANGVFSCDADARECVGPGGEKLVFLWSSSPLKKG